MGCGRNYWGSSGIRRRSGRIEPMKKSVRFGIRIPYFHNAGIFVLRGLDDVDIASLEMAFNIVRRIMIKYGHVDAKRIVFEIRE